MEYLEQIFFFARNSMEYPGLHTEVIFENPPFFLGVDMAD